MKKLLLTLTAVTFMAGTAYASSPSPDELLGQASDLIMTLRQGGGDKAADALNDAEGVLIFPYVDEHNRGDGIVLRHHDGQWFGPAFVELTGKPSKSVWAGNGHVVYLNDENMVRLAGETREAHGPDEEHSKMLEDVKASALYRDKVYPVADAGNLEVQTIPSFTRAYYGEPLWLSNQLERPLADDARKLEKALDGSGTAVEAGNTEAALPSFDAQQLLDRAAEGAKVVASGKQGAALSSMINKAPGFLMVPFMAEGEASEGLVMVKDGKGQWMGPAYVSVQPAKGEWAGNGWIVPLTAAQLKAFRAGADNGKVLTGLKAFAHYRDKAFAPKVIGDVKVATVPGWARSYYSQDLTVDGMLKVPATDGPLTVIRAMKVAGGKR